MKLAIMQPYFFPYPGYFDLIRRTDRWIVFDTVQYIRHGWINRNRILHPAAGWSYIIVPVHYSRASRIGDVQIAADGKWQTRLRGQVQHYKQRAPYWREVFHLLDECLDFKTTSIVALNVFALQKVCDYLRLPFNYSIFSEMAVELGPIESPGDWALQIAQALGAHEYINPPGGAALFDRARFEAAGIQLTIQPFVNLTYACDGYQFEPALSMLDVMLWNSPEKILHDLAAHQSTEADSNRME